MSSLSSEAYEIHAKECAQDSKEQPTNHELVVNTSSWRERQSSLSSGSIKQTPLLFKMRIGDRYYISYRPDLKKRFVPQLTTIILIAISIVITLRYIQISQSISFTLTSMLVLDIITFLILSFLDAGTLFQDQQEDFYGERIYCTICGYYRIHTTRHCVFCNRCTKKYDHHCSFFGKCIGAQNICFFYLFSIISGCTLVSSLVTILYALINSQIIVKP